MVKNRKMVLMYDLKGTCVAATADSLPVLLDKILFQMSNYKYWVISIYADI